MYKKVLSTTLAVMLLAVGVASPRIIDSFDNLLEKRYTIGTRNAIETLITQFNENKSFTIFTFLPTNDDYTLKLNGLELYLEETYVPMEDLEQDTLDLITKLSTGVLI